MPSGPAPTVVKLGGSVITRKREVERMRPKVLERLGRELAAPPLPGLIVLHGAGSFGHPGAHRFGLAAPPEAGGRADARLRGGALVAREVRRLHLAVLRSLQDAGAPAYSVPAASIARNHAGRLASFDEGPFRRALADGWLPVSFGDVVPDDAWGVSILSADTIALELGRRLGPRRVVFVSDVPGIYAPGNARPPVVVPRWSAELSEGLAPPPRGKDVTGGIRRKAEVMLALAQVGVPAGLVSGLSDGGVATAVRSEGYPYGTWALP